MSPVAALYARVSKDDQSQTTDNQIPELQAWAERNGYTTVEYLEEESGKAGQKRPVLAKLLADAKRHKFQAVIVWKMDRFGRSVKDFLTNVQVLDDAGIRFVTTTQPIDTDQRNPAGRLIMIILMAVAEFERDLIVERVRAGVARYQLATDKGKVGKSVHSKSGEDKAHGRPRNIWDIHRARELRATGMSIRKIAAKLDVKPSTLRLALTRELV